MSQNTYEKVWFTRLDIKVMFGGCFFCFHFQRKYKIRIKIRLLKILKINSKSFCVGK